MQSLTGFLVAVALFWASPLRAEAITAFAASSLRDALSEIAQRYEADTGTEVTLVFAASSSIARQVALGAPADVVLLADRDWAEWLLAQGVVQQVETIARNRLVLIAPAGVVIDDPLEIPALLGERPLAMAQVEAVPAGRYGKAALQALDLWDDLEPQVVQAANVRAALRFVERGEAAFGIGYASDLVALPTLGAAYEFPSHTHPEILFSGGALSEKGTAFMAFVQSETGQGALARWGFLPREVSQ